MSALPKEVQKKMAAAAAAYKAAYPREEGASVVPISTDPQALIDSINNPEPDANPVDLGAELAPEPTPEPIPEPIPEPAPGPVAPQDEPWKHKYDTLAGKYNAEVPRLSTEIKGLQDQISSLHQVLSTLEQPEEDPAPAASKPLTLLKDEEITAYGADMIDVVKRAAMEAISPELDKVRAENAQLKERLGGVTAHAAENARSVMFSGLAQAVPEWEEVNVAPEFLTWLQARDVYAGAARKDLLQQAFEANDTARVVAFFQGYQNEHAALASDNTPPTAPAKKPAVDMGDIVAPGKPRGNVAVERTQEGKRIWRQAEIAAFYNDVRRGAYKRDAKAKDTIEADILAASAEGRIVA